MWVATATAIYIKALWKCIKSDASAPTCSNFNSYLTLSNIVSLHTSPTINYLQITSQSYKLTIIL